MDRRYWPTKNGCVVAVHADEAVVFDLETARLILADIEITVAKWAALTAESEVNRCMLSFWTSVRDDLSAAMLGAMQASKLARAA